MIVNIAGTSGSGKTHLVRDFLRWVEAHKGTIEPCHIDDRKSAIGYDINLGQDFKTIHLVGAYSDALDTSGCDTIRDVIWVYDYIRLQHDLGYDVLYEGLFVMNMTRGPALAAERQPFHVIQLTSTLAQCIAAIDSRRDLRGDEPLRSKKNTRGNYTRAQNYCDVMRGAGATIHRTKREEALPVLLKILKC